MPHESDFTRELIKSLEAPLSLNVTGVGGAQLSAWLIAALRMLAAGGIAGVGFEVAQRGFPPEGLNFPGQVIDTTGRIIGIDGDGGRRRRRRRRALTASDRSDIAFIAGILGPKAGKDIAAIIAARTG